MEKRFQPSRKRLKKSRGEGNIPRSQYLSQAITPLVGVPAVLWMLSNSWVENKILLEYLWTGGLGEPVIAIKACCQECFYLVVKVLSICAVLAISCELAQVGINFLPSKWGVKFDRLNPAGGIIKIANNFKRGWLVALRLMLMIIVCAWYLHGVLKELCVSFAVPREVLELKVMRWIWQLILSAGSLLILISLADLVIRRRQWFQSVGMSLQDLREEHREDEGDPHMRSVRRAQHEALLREDLIQRVRKSKVIIVERNL